MPHRRRRRIADASPDDNNVNTGAQNTVANTGDHDTVANTGDHAISTGAYATRQLQQLV